MVNFENIKKVGGESVAFAVRDFITKNNLSEDKIDATIINEGSERILIRIFSDDWNAEKSRVAEKTVYHGKCNDIYIWTCMTRSSGVLEFDAVLTNEYLLKGGF